MESNSKCDVERQSICDFVSNISDKRMIFIYIYLGFLRLFTFIAPNDACNHALPGKVESWIYPGSECDLCRIYI